MAGIVPASGSFQTAHSTAVTMPADSPQNHLDKHALIDLNQQLFDNPAAGTVFNRESGHCFLAGKKNWIRGLCGPGQRCPAKIDFKMAAFSSEIAVRAEFFEVEDSGVHEGFDKGS
jgi:hypothetical protein